MTQVTTIKKATSLEEINAQIQNAEKMIDFCKGWLKVSADVVKKMINVTKAQVKRDLNTWKEHLERLKMQKWRMEDPDGFENHRNAIEAYVCNTHVF